MATVVITGVSPNPEVFGGLTAATTYLTAQYGDQYDTWIALSTNNQGRTLVTATSFLDRLGLIDSTGTAIDHDTVLEGVLFGTYELAALIADDPEIVSMLSSHIQSFSGGGVSIAFAGSSAGASSEGGLPLIVQQLIGPYLPGSVAEDDGYGQSGLSGAEDESECDFSTDNDYDRGEPW